MELMIFSLLAPSASVFFLKYRLRFNASLGSCITPLVVMYLGIIVATQLRDFGEAIGFMAAATAQFASFVFVSRLRQRGSFFWHAMAAIASNGTWYATVHILKVSNAYWLLFILYILGIVTGRLVGVGWAQYIESRYKLKSDATRDDRLAPDKRLGFIMREKMFWVLTASLIGYAVYGYANFAEAMFKSLLTVIGLGLLQSFFYAIATRASARGSNWYIVVAGLLGGVTFYINAAYLMSHQMPMQLIVPYVLSTVLGSVTGAFFSMIIEYVSKLAPDSHLEKPAQHEEKKDRTWLGKQLPYVVVMALALAWIFCQEPLLKFFGYSLSPLKFPIAVVTAEIPRIIILLTAALIFMLDSALHTLTSRAGNRSHTGYHVATLIPKGLADFSKVSYIALNNKIPDLVPMAVLAGCLGSLFGKDISEKIEKWLQARMDVEEPPVTAKQPA